MAAVEPLGEAAFELFDKDRDVIHAPAIRFQQPVAPIAPSGCPEHSRQLLLERFDAFRAVAGFDALKHFALRQDSVQALRTVDGSDWPSEHRSGPEHR